MKPFFIYMTLIAILDLTASLTAKFWSINKNPLLLISTFLMFGAAGILFCFSLKYQGIAIANIVWIAASAILVAIAGIFFFKENVTPIQITGIIILIIGLILINLK